MKVYNCELSHRCSCEGRPDDAIILCFGALKDLRNEKADQVFPGDLAYGILHKPNQAPLSAKGNIR